MLLTIGLHAIQSSPAALGVSGSLHLSSRRYGRVKCSAQQLQIISESPQQLWESGTLHTPTLGDLEVFRVSASQLQMVCMHPSWRHKSEMEVIPSGTKLVSCITADQDRWGRWSTLLEVIACWLNFTWLSGTGWDGNVQCQAFMWQHVSIHEVGIIIPSYKQKVEMKEMLSLINFDMFLCAWVCVSDCSSKI